MPLFPVYNSEGSKIEEIDLPESIFGAPINNDILHQAVVMYQAGQRQGTASTKERGAVSGGGKKPFRQKGTGRARAGSNRSPLWRKGGVVFGPHPRDFSFSVPQKIKTAALRESLNAKYLSSDLMCIDTFKVTTPKTKEFAKILVKLNLKETTLALSDKNDADVRKVSDNIPYFDLMRADDANAYHILCSKKLLVTKAALKSLLKRIK